MKNYVMEDEEEILAVFKSYFASCRGLTHGINEEILERVSEWLENLAKLPFSPEILDIIIQVVKLEIQVDESVKVFFESVQKFYNSSEMSTASKPEANLVFSDDRLRALFVKLTDVLDRMKHVESTLKQTEKQILAKMIDELTDRGKVKKPKHFPDLFRQYCEKKLLASGKLDGEAMDQILTWLRDLANVIWSDKIFDMIIQLLWVLRDYLTAPDDQDYYDQFVVFLKNYYIPISMKELRGYLSIGRKDTDFKEEFKDFFITIMETLDAMKCLAYPDYYGAIPEVVTLPYIFRGE